MRPAATARDTASDPTARVESALVAWLDDDDASALDAACRLAQALPVDVGALLAWVADYGAAPQPTELALRRLRFALGLPVVPGPVCRRSP